MQSSFVTQVLYTQAESVNFVSLLTHDSDAMGNQLDNLEDCVGIEAFFIRDVKLFAKINLDDDDDVACLL